MLESDANSEDQSQASSLQRIALLAVGVGVVLRVSHLISERSLWLDESMLALNILNKPWMELHQKLAYNQVAPLGFLYLEKLAVTALGEGELALRLVPCLAAVVALILFFKLSELLLEGPARSFSLLLFASSPSLVYYAAETKQYSLDVACAVCLLYLAVLAFREPNDQRRQIQFAGAGAVSVWFSFTAPFVLLGLWLGLLFLPKEKIKSLNLLLIAFLWVLSFAAYFQFSLHTILERSAMWKMWRDGFLPFPPTDFSELIPYGDAALELLTLPFSFLPEESTLPLLFAAAAGLLFLRFLQSCSHEEILITLPLLPLLGASLLSAYPWKGRLILFAVPIVVLAVAKGAQFAVESQHVVLRSSATLAACILLSLSLAGSVFWISAPEREEMLPVAAHVSQETEGIAYVYVHSGAIHAYKYYSRRFPALTTAGGIQPLWGRVLKAEEIDREVVSLAPGGRVWFVFSHVWSWGEGERKQFLTALRKAGKIRDRVVAKGAAAYLVDFS